MRIPAAWIVAAYVTMVRRLEARYRDPDFAHEVAADRLIEVLRRKSFEFPTAEAFYGLCLAHLEHRAWDQRDRLRRFVPLAFDPSTSTNLHRQLSEEVFQAIERLPDAPRKLVELYFYDGMSVRKIAASRAGSPETVRKKLSKTLHDALELLRTEIEDCPAA